MSEVKRFYIEGSGWGGDEDPNGDWVLAEDYDALAAQRDEGLAREAELRDALDHIAKTCGQSRTDSRRLRWIEYRANTALEGKPYDNSLIDLPKNGERNSAMLRARIDTLQQRLAEAVALVDRALLLVGEPSYSWMADAGVFMATHSPGCADGESDCPSCDSGILKQDSIGKSWACSVCDFISPESDGGLDEETP